MFRFRNMHRLILLSYPQTRCISSTAGISSNRKPFLSNVRILMSYIKQYLTKAGLFESTSQSSTRALGFLYYDLGCEYHLVQDPSDPARPFIPALTPKGFIQWQICLITAFPSYETQRFSAIAADLALEAVSETGERPERLPRQLSHYLFPSKRDDKSYRDVLEAFAAWKRAMTPSISQGAPAKTYRKESSRHSERDAVVVVPRRGSDPKSYDKRDRSPPRRSSRDLTPEKKSRRYSSGRSPSDRERAKRRDDSDYRKRSR